MPKSIIHLQLATPRKISQYEKFCLKFRTKEITSWNLKMLILILWSRRLFARLTLQLVETHNSERCHQNSHKYGLLFRWIPIYSQYRRKMADPTDIPTNIAASIYIIVPSKFPVFAIDGRQSNVSIEVRCTREDMVCRL